MLENSLSLYACQHIAVKFAYRVVVCRTRVEHLFPKRMCCLRKVLNVHDTLEISFFDQMNLMVKP